MRLRTSHRRTPRAATLPALLFAAVLGAPDGAAGQDDLERVEALAADGRTDEARVLLMEWWGEDREAASREDVQRGIWLRGRLTVDPGQAALEYWRLVVEYPGGPYTTGALERIGSGAAATGDTPGAVRAWETLVREHRGTPAAERAR
ncbi:MAG TPA: hypothetical protein VLL48_15215, partial [Longimicrobiales bacterium]|nr:hypothetical protein [Longimicrobiales bacterium]